MSKSNLFSLYLALLLLPSASVYADNDVKIVFGTNWFAGAGQGGFYQAIATGIYNKFGLNVEIK